MKKERLANWIKKRKKFLQKKKELFSRFGFVKVCSTKHFEMKHPFLLIKLFQNKKFKKVRYLKDKTFWTIVTSSGADAINISGLLNPKKLGKFTNWML